MALHLHSVTFDAADPLVGRYEEYGVTWASFRDPEGNEFRIGQHEPPQH
jgi:hypothetical protein